MIPCCHCTLQLLWAQWQIINHEEINTVDKAIGVISIWSAMKKYKPTDATTNPSLILQASQKPEYAKLIDDAVEHAKAKGGWVPCVCLYVGRSLCVCVCVCVYIHAKAKGGWVLCSRAIYGDTALYKKWKNCILKLWHIQCLFFLKMLFVKKAAKQKLNSELKSKDKRI